MKNLTGALVFSLSLLFTTGCHKNTGASPDRTDPLASEHSGATGTSEGALKSADTVEACVDRWLESRALDRYGHEQGTVYAGGTPLFNEATGESRDRMDYVFERHPEAREACATSGDGGTEH